VSNTGADSVLFRVEHHFATPDTAGMDLFPYTLTNRYWRVYGQFSPSFAAQATILYDGRGQADQLDTELFAATGNDESQLFLLYRPGAGEVWQVYPDYTRVNIGTGTDKFGQFKLSAVKAGEYTIGKLTSASASREPVTKTLMVYPNPAVSQITVESDIPLMVIKIIGSDGVTLRELRLKNENAIIIDTGNLPAGQYRIIGSGDTGIRTASMQRH
jgi:hypothetical protein